MNYTKKLSILNFDINDSFFFKLTNLDYILKNITSLNELYPCENDIESLKNEIMKTLKKYVKNQIILLFIFYLNFLLV